MEKIINMIINYLGYKNIKLFISGILFFTTVQFSFSQLDSISEHKFVIPKSLNDCVVDLNNTFTQKAKEKLVALKEDSIKYIYDIYIFDEWLRPDSSRLKYYFKSLGLYYDFEIEYFILLSFSRYLKVRDPDISPELKLYTHKQDSIRFENQKECKRRQSLDSIDGQYIPKDLLDFYKELDRILSDSLKLEIKHSNNMIEYHMGLGRWIRNNMGLWGCSRFQNYFLDNNIRHPDYMSGLALDGYKLYLNDTILDIIDLEKRIPPIPPPSEVRQRGIFKNLAFKNPYQREINRFIRRRRIDDFSVGNYSLIK